MKKVHNLYFICEDSHLTVGDNKRELCSQKIIEMEWSKDAGKKKFEMKEKAKKTCGKRIIETHSIPEHLDIDEIWDERKMKAFLIDQQVGSDFVISIQEEICKLHKKIDSIELTLSGGKASGNTT